MLIFQKCKKCIQKYKIKNKIGCHPFVLFMTEGMVSLGVAATTQDGNPHRKAECLRYQGKWKILHLNWKGASTS